jgi:hypothetical protein
VEEESIPEVLPVTAAEQIPEALPVAAEATEDDDPNAEWRNIHLELKKDAESEIDLEKPKDE